MARSTRNTAAKRKPFGERSNDTIPTASTNNISKKTKKTNPKKAKKKARRQSRQIGDDVVFYIQEKKAKSGKLYRAKVVAGGLTFTPANRKTPIAYDRHRHRLIEKTPEGDEVEVELDCWEDKENIDNDNGDNELVEVPRAREASKRSRATRANYVDMSSDDENEESEEAPRTKSRHNAKKQDKDDDENVDDDYEEHIEDVAPRAREESKRTKRTKKASYVESSTVYDGTEEAAPIKSRNKRGAKKQDRSDSDESVDETPTPTRNRPFSSPIVKSNWEDSQPDWRCAAAMDY